MDNLKYNDIRRKKAFEIGLVEEKLRLILNECPIGLDLSGFLFNGAKRLRPLFIFLICDYKNFEIDENIINLAVGIELLHSASLIHDDILDNALKRRGADCIYVEKGCKTGVLAGDYLLSLAMKKFFEINNIKIFEIMAETSYKMAKSEIDSLNSRFQKPDLKTYLERSKEKTSTLFLAALHSIAAIKGVKIENQLIEFTENFSLCFQIKDDINNYYKKDVIKEASDKECGIYTLHEVLNGEKDCDIIYLNNLIKKTRGLLNSSAGALISLLELFKG